MNQTIQLRLTLTLAWDQIDELRQAVALCVQAVFGSQPFRDAISMVSTELLENAVKYGRQGVVRLAIEERADGVNVMVTNPVDDSGPHAATLEKHIAWLDRFGDVRQAYMAALTRAYDEGADSGLGLARIMHEGRCSVRCDTSASGEVTVTARCRRPDPTAAPAVAGATP